MLSTRYFINIIFVFKNVNIFKNPVTVENLESRREYRKYKLEKKYSDIDKP